MQVTIDKTRGPLHVAGRPLPGSGRRAAFPDFGAGKVRH